MVSTKILEKEKQLEDFDIHHNFVENLSEILVNFVVLVVAVTELNILEVPLHFAVCLTQRLHYKVKNFQGCIYDASLAKL